MIATSSRAVICTPHADASAAGMRILDAGGTAIDAMLADLASGRPMDRLVCGDVGFGKTEIALRAAAAVALSGRQVA